MKSSCNYTPAAALAALVAACVSEAPAPEGELSPRSDGGLAVVSDASVTLDAAPAPPQFGLVSSVPTANARVYGRRIYDLAGSPAQHRIEMSLSHPPAQGARPTFVLAGGTDTRRLDARCDGVVCTANVPDVPYVDAMGEARTSAFRYSTSYAVTLEALEGSSTALQLAFETLPFDEELEHTCGHTIDPTSVTLGLAEQAATGAVISLTHRRHRIAFPLGATAGVLSLRVPGAGAYPYSIYLSSDLGLEIRRPTDGVRMSEFTSAVPAACDRLVAVSRVTLYGGELYEVRLSAPTLEKATTFELYLERKASRAQTADGGTCRSSGPCVSDAECCDYCHDRDHCH